MKKTAFLFSIVALLSAPTVAAAPDNLGHHSAKGSQQVTDEVIAKQRANLVENTRGKGFGPQSPRDIDLTTGNNKVVFSTAPAYTEMNLCNIHFHKNAEHRGGQYTRYVGNGNGQGQQTGYAYAGKLTASEVAPVSQAICAGEHGGLQSGDTIEVHYVHSTARVKPGPTLGACLSAAIKNPQLRVEAQVYVLVNDSRALDFAALTRHGKYAAFYQALNIPDDTGTPVAYAGSTTGPDYNETGSPIQVSWSVRPDVVKVNIASVGKWCADNVFNEDHAHGVRNLVVHPGLLSPIE